MDIFSAAREGNTKLIQELYESGIAVNGKNEKGHSPLMLASYNGHYDATKLLLNLGADVNSVDESSNSILMGVIFKGHTPIFDLLVQAGVDLDHQNKKSQTAMDLAVMFGRRNLIFRINQLQNSSRSTGKLEQIKTWAQKII
ncbi:MAG: ankyrin repeat domain-containing protein [Pseudobdellovibrionaceae bacterium]|jgi:ankyrin repeat protein